MDGTSSSENSRQRPGDGESPGGVVRSEDHPEPPEERPTPHTGGRQVEPAAVRTERVSQQQWVTKKGGTAGATGVRNADLLVPSALHHQAEATHEKDQP